MKEFPALSLFILLAVATANAQSSNPSDAPKEKVLGFQILIEAPLDSVWMRVSTERGWEKFFAPECNLETKTFGKMDVFFAPNAPAGQRGAEDNRVIAVQPKSMISFTWDAPPQFSEIRKSRTLVSVRLYARGKNETLVTLSQTGWGIGADWDTVYNYFTGAWSGFVLPNLKYSLEVGPINWADFPKNAPQGLKPAEKF